VCQRRRSADLVSVEVKDWSWRQPVISGTERSSTVTLVQLLHQTHCHLCDITSIHNITLPLEMIIIIIIIIINCHFNDAQLTKVTSQRRLWRRQKTEPKHWTRTFSENVWNTVGTDWWRSANGRLFHDAGPDEEKLRSPSATVCVLGITSSLSSADRSWDRLAIDK